MRTLQTGTQSRFTALAALARCVIDAPVGPKGAPCVFAQLTHKQGQPFLVAKTCDQSHDAELALVDTDPQRQKAALDYFVERLKTIGMQVVSDESQLRH